MGRNPAVVSTTSKLPRSAAQAADTFRAWLGEADRILVAAGAGLSAAAGYDYGDAERFRELLPALHRLGLRSRYLLGVPLPKDMMWGYWAVHIDDIRYSTGPNPLYQRLRELVGDRDHRVMTSNVDALFVRNGFAADRVFTPRATTAGSSAPFPARGRPGRASRSSTRSSRRTTGRAVAYATRRPYRAVPTAARRSSPTSGSGPSSSTTPICPPAGTWPAGSNGNPTTATCSSWRSAPGSTPPA